MRATLAVAALAAAALAAAPAQAKIVRVFAVGPKLTLDWVDTREDFRAHMLGLVDKGVRGEDVQAEADDVASHLLDPPAQRNFVALPEDLGLMTIFSGSRGADARRAGDVTTAIVSVLQAYAPQTAYYSSKYPSLASRGIPTRVLALGATDTFARIAVETYAEIAQRLGVWLEGGVNMAQDWQVVCESRASMPAIPGGVGCDVEDPAKVALLQTTDEPDRPYAYEATSDRASNMALVFDPRGRLVSRQIKTYLTPIELPGQLDLAPGAVFTGLTALETPVGTLGFVTSKDAWMPDVTARLDQLGVDLLVQPEFFVGDTIATTGPWAPDNIKGSGYSDVLRHPSIEAMVLPELTGNLFDLSADNQQAIVVKPRGRSPRGHLLGQPEVPGWKVVGDWVADDPLGDPIARRRRRLGEIGERLLPREGNQPCPSPQARGACRGGQVEDVIWADVRVARDPAYRPRPRRKAGRTPFSVNRPLAGADARQRNVALAADRRLVVAAFEQGDEVFVARSVDRGRTWGAPVALGSGETPAVAVSGAAVWVAWSAGALPGTRVRVARSGDGGATFEPPVAADGSVGEAVSQLRPAVAATAAGRAFVAFVDDRTRFTGDDLPQAGIWGVALDGLNAGPAVRLDSTEAPAELSATLDNAWAPALAARGPRLELAWIDFRDYEWNVYARSSGDGGATWGDERLVNDTPDSDEALEDGPRPAFLGDSPLIAYTDWAKSAKSAQKASPLYDIAVSLGGRERKADGTGGRHVNAFSPAVAAAGPAAFVAWQDHRRGEADLYARRVTAKRLGRVVRVDDTGRRAGNQWRPALAVAGRMLVAAWEDERDGPRQIFFARAPLRRISR